MPPKRRGAQAKAPAPNTPCPPDPPKPPHPSKQAPVPVSMPPPPPLPESDAARVRKEWSKFIDAWYEPHKKKLVDKLQKDILVKYKDLGPPKETEKLREMELFERLDSVAQQLAQPARIEWERRLELAQLREDQWNDMSGEEQQTVLCVFAGLFSDDIEDMDHDDISANPSSIEEETIVEEPHYRASPHIPPSRQAIPPTPTRGNFEFVNPTSFFVDTMTPPNPTRNLPALPMDHLATLGPSNSARPAETISGGVGGTFGFQNWASEVGIVTQPQSQPTKPSPPSASASAQTLSARPRATENMSRQASAASYLSSPLSKTSSPQYSPPNPTTKFSPPINSESLPLGKRYIGPIITEEEPDPMNEELLRSKMADDYQQYKISLRIQMIYEFHAEAADIEIKLFESLLTDQGTKESRARAVQEHESSMMRLREQKEEERKRRCAEEREKRRQEIRQHLAQRRSAPNREVEPGPKPSPPVPPPEKPSVQHRPARATHQKENIPVVPPAVAPSTKLDSPTAIKKSNSSLSQDEAAANEALFANAMTMLSQGKAGAAGLTPAQASLNEALFSNAATMLSAPGPLESSGKNTLQPPSIVKRSTSSRSQEYDIPQITVSLAELAVPTPAPASVPVTEPAQVPPTTAKGKKSKKGQPVAQPPVKPVTVTVASAEPPPPAPSLWDAATVVAKSAWGAASSSISSSKLNTSIEGDGVAEQAPTSKGSVNTKKAGPAAKKGKKVTITEEPDVDADPIISPPPTSKTTAKGGWSVNGKSKVTPPAAEEPVGIEPVLSPPPVLKMTTKSAWGSANGKPNATPPLVTEESVLQPPPVASAWGKNAASANKSLLKPHLKVSISEEERSELEPSLTRTNKPKSAWGAPTAVLGNTGVQAGKKAAQQQAEPRRGAAPSPISVRVFPVPDSDEESLADDNMLPPGSEEAEEERDPGGWLSPENMNYWANFMAGQAEAETETETEAVAEPTEQTSKHARWMPTVSESDDEGGFGDLEEELATNMWMQYAISGGDVPSLGDTPGEPHATSFEGTQRNASAWEQGAGKKKKKSSPPTDDFGNRAQQTLVFDRAAFAGQWPKMESWMSPPARGQSSGSARVF